MTGKKPKAIGIRKDRFTSKLELGCKHDWQPFGVPIDSRGGKRQTYRCPSCKLTKVDVQPKGDHRE